MTKATPLIALTLVTALSLSLLGCASSPYESKPRWSYAKNVMEAAGFKNVNDTKAPKGSVRDGTIGYGEGLLSAGASGLSDVAGLGFGMSFGLDILSSVVFSEQVLENYNMLIAWIPAEDKNQASKRLLNVVSQNLTKPLAREYGNHLLPLDSVVENNANFWTGAPVTTNSLYWRIKGTPPCVTPEIRCGYLFSFTDSDKSPLKKTAPGFLDQSSPARFFSLASLASYISAAPTASEDTKASLRADPKYFADLSVFTNLSAKLPPWVFIYLAPNKNGYRDPKTNEVKPWPLPVVLNQGKMHFFIKPN